MKPIYDRFIVAEYDSIITKNAKELGVEFDLGKFKKEHSEHYNVILKSMKDTFNNGCEFAVQVMRAKGLKISKKEVDKKRERI